MIQLATLLMTIYCLKDEFHRGHAERVYHLSMRIAELLDVPEPARKLLRYAALFHDVGKAFLPEEILSGKELTDEEWYLVKNHPVFGYEIFKFFAPDIAFAIRSHHENWDGSGYPDGKAKSEIPFCARIIRIADSVDAALSVRTYKQPKSIDEVLEEIEKGAGTLYDPYIAELFVEDARKKGGVICEENHIDPSTFYASF